jgi:ketohexokinase
MSLSKSNLLPPEVPCALILISTIGAGDTFIAGILYGLNCRKEEWSVAQNLGFANRLAGNKVVQEGFSGLGQTMKDFL